MNAALDKAQQVAQSGAGRSMDGVAFLGGIAVWQEWVPTAVGIVTIVWFTTQVLLSIPKLVGLYRWLFNKETK